ncbi:MAG: hypothetical protein M1824_006048 [Vezdaea acicularis]|nr:MAG: hypothetical protein M1824_006048 [Vezdaea acicularis]
MADLPATQALLDPREQPILDHILKIRDNLSLLKQDKTTYVRSHDVITLYEQLIEQVHLLNDIRAEKRSEQNRVDKVLDDCFQLISLFFMTIGRNNEAPAVSALSYFTTMRECLRDQSRYATTSTVKRLVEHLQEAAFYSEKDLKSLGDTLSRMRKIVEQGKEAYSPHLVTLLTARLDSCEKKLLHLRRRLSQLSPEISPIWEKQISILRSMAAASTRQKFAVAEVQKLQGQLKDIEKTMVDGNFVNADGSVMAGQELVQEMLHRCIGWSHIVLTRQGRVDEAFKPKYDKLCDIRNKLEKLSLTHAWSLRETDLFGYQRELDRIDETRVNGNFVDDEGNPADLFAQRTLLYLIRRSYAYIYELIISSEPVSEALLPIYNQLQTLKRCLLEVKNSGGVSSPRELYPYSMKLTSIDDMRVDGKFKVGSELPEGQGSVTGLLEECFELRHELAVAAEEPGT